MTEPISILLADDHAILRTGLRLLIDAQPDLKVVGETGDGKATLAQAEALRPAIILLDLTMPDLGGLDVLPLLKQRAPDSRVLILTMHDNEGYLRQALESGAAGYVLKGAVDSELLNAIRAVARGETYIHSAITHKLLESIQPSAPVVSDPWEGLSAREFDVLRLVALGYTNGEIAEQFSISVKTVETHRARGMEKLGLRTRAELVRAAIAKGLLE
jgi:two-component system response regulator NreC